MSTLDQGTLELKGDIGWWGRVWGGVKLLFRFRSWMTGRIQFRQNGDLWFGCVTWKAPVGLASWDVQQAAGHLGLKLSGEGGLEVQSSESSPWGQQLCCGVWVRVPRKTRRSRMSRAEKDTLENPNIVRGSGAQRGA